MIFETKTYRFTHDQLEVTQLEKQEWNEEKGIYINTVQELKNGKLTTVSKKEIQPPR